MAVVKLDQNCFIFWFAVETKLHQRITTGIVVNFVNIEGYIKKSFVTISIDCGRQSVAPINCGVIWALLNHLF